MVCREWDRKLLHIKKHSNTITVAISSEWNLKSGMEPKGQNGKPPHQLTWRSFQGLLHRNNVVVHLIVLFLGHLQIGLQMFAEVPHGLPHHLPKTLLDLADGRELVQSKLVVPNLTTESFTICHGDGRILSRFITCWYICRKQPHSQVASPVVRVQQRWAETGGTCPT